MGVSDLFKVKDFKEKIKSLENQNADYKKQIEIEKDKSIKIDIKNRNLKLENEKIKKEVLDNQNKIIELEMKIENIVNKYRKNIEENRINIVKLEADLHTSKEKYKKKSLQNKNLKLKSEKIKEESIFKDNEIARFKDEIQEVKESIQEILGQNKNLKFENEKYKNDEVSKNNEISRFKDEIQGAKDNIQEILNQNKNLKFENEKYKNDGISKDNEISRLKGKIRKIEEKIIFEKDLSKRYIIEKNFLNTKISEYKEILNDKDYYKIRNNKKYIGKLEDDKKIIEEIIKGKEYEVEKLINHIEELKEQIIVLDDEILYQSFGIYIPLYNFLTSEQYKNKLLLIRDEQKRMIKSKTATCNLSYWGIDSNINKEVKLHGDNVKQIIRCFNGECEAIINKVKFNNLDSIKNRIEKSYNTLNKMNKRNGIEISKEYLNLKYQELDLVYEYNVKKQEEKEQARTLREAKREEEKLQKEIEDKRRELEKEKMHYNNVMKNLDEQIKNEKSETRLEVLTEKKADVENNLNDVYKALEEVDYREANYRAGYVYIISNIGAFGEDVYKIGMTRRLEPQDRIDELSSASVPFKFDVHAMIFSDDAPKLENVIHKAFEDKKINVVNGRKEFFKVSIEEIEDVVKANYDKSVDFIKVPEAQQYRESMKLKECKRI
ncbi:DUF4041 domain-containing protein [Clostridium sp. SHJSY1]|uniref:DUF4041 domain-containing protein n=1 Tax=Clostridium sp. SHJSY1 TaxID=2942483 RepID=UPI00287545D4|nr:DUF4041 domain-containing protein [Clostridium sp. SHJSY1]MDS0528531.1 DUF4041 domain-containing protein [Clostridium sp. SHJSY1]